MKYWFGAVALAVVVACGDDSQQPSGGGPASGGAGGSNTGGEAAGGNGQGGGYDGTCSTTVTFEPGYVVSNVRIAGSWQGFDLATATPMTGPTAGGQYTATVDLPPGLHGYKIVYDDPNGGGTQWILNPSEGRRTYVDGTENSAIKVRDCSRPALTVNSSEAGVGTFDATLSFVPPANGGAPTPGAFTAELRNGEQVFPLSEDELIVAADGTVTIAIEGLDDGKYHVVVTPAAEGSPPGEPIRLVFWIEPEPFDWNGALIYMVMTDRYRDGDPSNDAPATPNADPRGDFEGGDLEGLRQSIADGTLDELGVRAIWLTPFQTNPDEAYVASDGVHMVTGYHGYWPVKAREVDPRLGGAEALHALVEEAHAHGIRILQDFVVNHVHEKHEYATAHPEWFRTGCVCGTDNCDWTAHALDCMFASYMPDINHTVPQANAQFVDDAVWWLDTFDLDGLRVDAVKHVEEIATRNLSAAVHEAFEQGGTRYFLMGETAMGWSDCPDPCNDENYGTISKYIGPHGLDGQFDFVLYHGVSYRTFAWGEKGMLHADYWLKHGLERWPAGAVMTPYIGSHDTSRFTSMADYRGQDPAHDKGIPGNQWENTAVAPSDVEPYRRTRVAMAWLLGLPGAPLLYYGDEYGQWGGADPNNRLFFRDEGALTPDEAATLEFVRRLGTARRSLPALQRGTYVTLYADEDTLVFGRKTSPADSVVVALTRSGSDVPSTFDVGGALGFTGGTTLSDALGGPSTSVADDGTLSITIPASSAVVLHP
ncbi:MAG: glycosyl hydrolase [Polyangiaceae bacterium]|nr:glycosyl hydrolase [Polyangiaceae bacterium]